MQMLWSLKLLILVWDGVRKSFSLGWRILFFRKNKNQGGGVRKSLIMWNFMSSAPTRERCSRAQTSGPKRDEGTD